MYWGFLQSEMNVDFPDTIQANKYQDFPGKYESASNFEPECIPFDSCIKGSDNQKPLTY